MQASSRRNQLLEQTRSSSISVIDTVFDNAAAVLEDVAQAIGDAETSGEAKAMPQLIGGASDRIQKLADSLRQPRGEQIVDQSLDFAGRNPGLVASGAAVAAGIATYLVAVTVGRNSRQATPAAKPKGRQKPEQHPAEATA